MTCWPSWREGGEGKPQRGGRFSRFLIAGRMRRISFPHARERWVIGSAGRKMTAWPARRGGKEDEVDEQALFRKVQSVLAERLARDPGEITRESRLQEDLEVDSLDLVDLSMVLEDEYGIDILEGEVGDIVTVGDVVRLVLDRLLQKEGEVK